MTIAKANHMALSKKALEGFIRGLSWPSKTGQGAWVHFSLPYPHKEAWAKRRESEGLKISMDGRGRVYDNIFIERFWRTVKYEEVYLREHRTGAEARAGLMANFRYRDRKFLTCLVRRHYHRII
jgi:transposase InsO family protein